MFRRDIHTHQVHRDGQSEFAACLSICPGGPVLCASWLMGSVLMAENLCPNLKHVLPFLCQMWHPCLVDAKLQRSHFVYDGRWENSESKYIVNTGLTLRIGVFTIYHEWLIALLENSMSTINLFFNSEIWMPVSLEVSDGNTDLCLNQIRILKVYLYCSLLKWD